MPEKVAFHILRTAAELHAFVPQWLRLWEADPQATPFQHPAWLLPWWRHFGSDDRRAVVIKRENAVVGFLPLYVLHGAAACGRQLLPVGVSTTDYLDGLFTPQCRACDLRAALDRLLEEDGWDNFWFPQMQQSSRLLAALRGSAGLAEFPTESCSRMPAVPVSELPQKIRRNAMYYRNRARRAGDLQLEMATRDTCLAHFKALQQLHTERWESRGEPGVLADPRVLAWHCDALPGLADAALLRLCSLKLDEQVLGVMYGLADGATKSSRTQYFYLTAFSRAHADLRPGTLLLAECIERAAAEGFSTVDMLRGEEEYKQLWHMERVPTFGLAAAAAAEQENKAERAAA